MIEITEEEEKIMKKRVLGNKKREILLFVERILMVILAVCIALIFTNSFFSISTSYGTTYHYVASPLEQDRPFEEKEIFAELLKGNMEQITRYVVICNQLETNGKYDPNKKIEITEYANRMGNVIGEQPRAEFYLDDLITWGNYGFTYNTMVGTWEELSAVFEPKESTEEMTVSEIEEYEGSLQENANDIEISEEDKYAMEVLVSRYKTVDGKELIECAKSVEEYEILKENLIKSASELFNNYTEYTIMQQQYSMENTNIGFCYQIKQKDGFQYYTNSEFQFNGKNEDDITAYVKELGGKFIYFNPDKVQINTNTGISAKQMRSLLKEYEYSFGDQTRVWVWVDSEYTANDSLQRVKNELSEFKPYFITLFSCACVAFGMIVLLLVYLTYKEGRVSLEDGIGYIIKKQDGFPLEIWMLLALVVEVSLATLGWHLFIGYKNGTIVYEIMPVAIGALAFVANEIGIRAYFSLVRRIKTKKIWKTTFIYMFAMKSKEILIRTFNDGGVTARTWMPYLIFLMINLILVLLGLGGVIGAFILDILVGIYLYRENKQRDEIVEGIELIKNGNFKHQIDTVHLHGDNLKLANSVNSIGVGIRKAVESSMKDEKLKTDLITNVSHDIKTPLTSIITYVDLLKRENISDSRILGYIDILDNKSQRLKQLIDDLVDASKISSGNINIQLATINFAELVKQAIGEFGEKFEEKELKIVTRMPEEAMLIEADSSQLWRVMENLFQNISKYALAGTRVYVEMEYDENQKKNIFSVKNISAKYLDVEAEDLTERFIRGDQSRQTEGSGLGLSIAKNLIEIQDGEFEIQVDGDLFKAIIKFPAVKVSSTK